MPADRRQIARWGFALPPASILFAALVSSDATFGARALAGGVLALSAWKPAWGLSIVAALAPIGAVVAGGLNGPISFAEIIVLAFLVGWLVRPSEPRPGPRLAPVATAAAWVLAAATVVAMAAERTADIDLVRLVEGIAVAVAAIDLLRRRPIVAVDVPAALAVSASVLALSVLFGFGDVRGWGGFAMIALVAAGMATREPGRRRAAWLAVAVAMAVVGVRVGAIDGPIADAGGQQFVAQAGWLGGAGLLVFVGAVLWQGVQGARARPRNGRLLGCIAGAVVFVGACFASGAIPPLDAAIPFWLVLGLTAALGSADSLTFLTARGAPPPLDNAFAPLRSA
jgi:hypothetical protein